MEETTIRDIARLCGVGVSTVSRAINNHPDINPETRRRIMEVIAETGFVPNNSAINLKKSDARSIALLIKGITNQFFGRMIQVMEDRAQKQGYATILRHVEAREDEVQVALQLVKEKRLRGIVFLGGNFTHDEAMLRQLRVPFVFSTVGMPQGEQTWYANVAVDDRLESAKLIDYLIGQGHRRIAIITDAVSVPSVGQLRYQGYADALRRHGLTADPELVREVAADGNEHYTMENGYAEAKKLLASGEPFTAIFCIADIFAVGACRAILDAGLRIPEDISVAGYDGIAIGSFYAPRITTIVQPAEEMAAETIRLLFDMIGKKGKPETILMPAELVVRESSGPAASDIPQESGGDAGLPLN